jgi:hypothetical protein
VTSSFRALRLRSFALLWSGQTISRLGDRFYQVALVWWVLEKTGSAVVMGTVLIFFEVPMLIFVLLGGALVDRWPRLPVMMLSDLLRGLAVGVMAALAYANLLQVWHIYIISLIFGIVDAFFQPAYHASVPEIVPLEHLPSANSLTSLSGEICDHRPGIGRRDGRIRRHFGRVCAGCALFFYFGGMSVANPTRVRFPADKRTGREHSTGCARRAGDGIWKPLVVDHDWRSRDFQYHLCRPDGCGPAVFD